LVSQHVSMLVKEVHNLKYAECVDELFSSRLLFAEVEDLKLLSNQAVHYIIQCRGADVVYKN